MEIVGIFLGLWMLRRVHKSYSRGYVSEWKMAHNTGGKFYKVKDPVSFWTHITAESVLGMYDESILTLEDISDSTFTLAQRGTWIDG